MVNRSKRGLGEILLSPDYHIQPAGRSINKAKNKRKKTGRDSDYRRHHQ